MPEEHLTSILDFITDKSSLNEVLAAADKLEARYSKLNEELKRHQEAMKASAVAAGSSAREWHNMASAASKVKYSQLKAESVSTADALQELNRRIIEGKFGLDKQSEAMKENAARMAELRKQALAVGHVAMGTRAVGRSFEAFGAGVTPVTGPVADVMRATRGLIYMKRELPGLTAALKANSKEMAAVGTTALAIVVVWQVLKAAMNKYNKEAEKAKEATESYMARMKDLNELLVRGDRQALEEAQMTAKIEMDIAMRNLQSAQQRLDISEKEGKSLENAVRVASGGYDLLESYFRTVGKIADSLGVLDFSAQVDADAEAVREAVVALDSAQKKWIDITDALNKNKDAFGDFFVQLEKHRGYLQSYAQQELETRSKIRKATSDQIREEIADTEDRISVMNFMIDLNKSLYFASNKSAEATSIYLMEESRLTEERDKEVNSLKILKEHVLALVMQREEETRAIEKQREANRRVISAPILMAKDFAKGIMSQVSAAKERYEIIGDFVWESIQLEKERASEILQEQEDYNRKRSEDISDFYKDLAKFDRDYYEKRQNLLDKIAEEGGESNKKLLRAQDDLNKDLQRMLEDHIDNINRINSEADLKVAEAAARLDAVSVLRAQRERRKELEEENLQYEKKRRRRIEDFNENVQYMDQDSRAKKSKYARDLADLDRFHERDRAEKIADFNLQLQREDQERAIRLRRQNQEWLKEKTQLSIQAARRLQIIRSSWELVNAETKNQMRVLQATISNTLKNLILMSRGYDRVRGGYIPAYQHGGEVRRTGLIHAEKREEVIRPDVAEVLRRAMGGRIDQNKLLAGIGGANIAIPITINVSSEASNRLSSVRQQEILQRELERTVLRFFEGRAGGMAF